MSKIVRALEALPLMLAAALVCVSGPASGDDKDRFKGVPDDALKQLVEREAKLIREKLKSSEEDDHKRAAFGVLMVAGYASSHAKKADALWSRAMDLGKAITTKGKLDQARKLAAALTDAGAYKTEDKGAWKADVDTADLMNPLKTVAKGGDGIHPDLQVNIRLKQKSQNGVEEKIRNLALKKLTETTMGKASKELTLLGYQMAVLADVVHDYAPKKNAKQWHMLSVDMRAAAIDLAQAAQKKNIDAVYESANKLNSACNSCHTDFRKK